jgi:hypothetical protein
MKSAYKFLLGFLLLSGLGAAFSGCVAEVPGGGVAVGVYAPDPGFDGGWGYGHGWHGGGGGHPYRR